MFIVVVTLGLLAVMGVYGLTATSADVKAAGHMREALQAQKAGEHALVMTAETLNPQTVGPLIGQMSTVNRTTNCKTAATYAGPLTLVPPAAACLRLTEAGMTAAALGVNAYLTTGFAPDTVSHPGSFGPVSALATPSIQATPTVQVELSNPVDVQRPGFDPATNRFTQVTTTVFVSVQSGLDPTGPALSTVAGRGRLTVGPIAPPPASYP